jgi:hypothetical protein
MKSGSREADMTGQWTSFRHTKAITGVALVGLGTFSLYQNLTGAFAQLNHVLDANGLEVLGVPLAIIQAVFQVLHAYAADHQRFLQVIFRQMLVLAWPLMLVIVGTALSGESFRDNV